jgi:ketosteroid isomerase-like protein
MDTTQQTEATVARHIAAFGAGVDALVSDYTEDSIMFTPNGPIKGLAGHRAFFEAFLKNSPPEMLAAIKIIRQDFDGEVAYQTWSAEPFVLLATDTFVVRDGKIKLHTWAAKMGG